MVLFPTPPFPEATTTTWSTPGIGHLRGSPFIMADLVASELTQRAMSGESSVLNLTRFTIIATCVVGARGEVLTGHVGGAWSIRVCTCAVLLDVSTEMQSSWFRPAFRPAPLHRPFNIVRWKVWPARLVHSISSHRQKNRVAPSGKYHRLPHKYYLLRRRQNVKTSCLPE